MDYRATGVDVDAGAEVVRRIKELARGTHTPGVVADIGLFGGLFRLDRSRYDEPVLVASVDGVGTKLRVALLAHEHKTVGVDLVNHCVNDVLAQGAEPLFFLDYLATGRLSPDIVAEVVSGVAEGCRANCCALIGGETAEMPGFYAGGDYDLAGFIVGVVERRRIVDGSSIVPSDVLIGLPSSGLHTNGYSLARRIIFDQLGLTVRDYVQELGESVGTALLRPHRSYLPVLRPLLTGGLIKGMAHITGGGLTDNLPRILPFGVSVEIDRQAWPVPALFGFLQRHGQVPDQEVLRTFNMGIGFVLFCAAAAADGVREQLASAGERDARVIGRVVEGTGRVAYA